MSHVDEDDFVEAISTIGSHKAYRKTAHRTRRKADAVILVDVSMRTWAEGHSDENSCTRRPGLLFYTGASRAKQELRIVCNMGEDDFEETMAAMGIRARRRPFNEFKKKVNAVVG